jgi:alkaline phosphatase
VAVEPVKRSGERLQVHRGRPRALALVLLIALCGAWATAAEDSDGEWRCLAVSGARPPGWTEPGFDDSRWGVGSTGLGGTSDATLLLRRAFRVPDPGLVTGLTLTVAGDGPVTVHLNGIEAFRSPRPLPYRVDATTGEVSGYAVNLGGIAHELLRGENVVAVEVGGLVAAPDLHLVTAGEAPPGEPPRAPSAPGTTAVEPLAVGAGPRFVILMICDGCGPKHFEAANLYAGLAPSYQTDPQWSQLWMATFPEGGGYDGALAWSQFSYPLGGTTDSAAAATAMFTGHKTAVGKVCVDASTNTRFESLSERARPLRMAAGAITTVPVSHATPAAFTSHNISRYNTFAIGDEAIFGDPNTTGTVADDPKYGGGVGPTLPPTDVLIGTRGADYLNSAQKDKLELESGLEGKHRLVAGETGVDGSALLLDAAADPTCTMLFAHFRRAVLNVTVPGGGYLLETPSLAESTTAALTVLGRSASGFVLMVEGGVVDWAAHANEMDRAIGELLDFNGAVDAVVDWVDDPANASTWDNTLVVVTADHETGYLTAGPGVFPDQPLGSVDDDTLALEKLVLSSGRRASWVDDNPLNDEIDPGETVYWAWNTGLHSNTLVPLFARGAGSERFAQLALGADPVRGPYLDNTAVFEVAAAVVDGAAVVFSDGFESGDASAWTLLAGGAR